VFPPTYIIKKYLITHFDDEFFRRSERAVVDEYKTYQHDNLGVPDPDPKHIRSLHQLGYLPIEILSLPEGSITEMGVPHAVISNTHPDFAWLPQALETLWSLSYWEASTNAAIAREYRKIMTKWALEAGERDLGFINYQGHDFSMRGLSGLDSVLGSSMAHLLSFSGTDSVPGIEAAKRYYGAPQNVGGSVAATEHWVMCAWIASVLNGDGELEGYRELITKRYPKSLVSIVSDTRSLWDVLNQIVPALKEDMLQRPAPVIFRPDSGDPESILCGDARYASVHGAPQALGALRILAQQMGTVPGGGNFPMINKAGAIYGDAITLERCNSILRRIVTELKLSPFVQVFGIGSYTYRYNTRDTHGWKLAPAAAIINGDLCPLEKKPVTDDGGKHSYRGLVTVEFPTHGNIFRRADVSDNREVSDLYQCAYCPIFRDSMLLIDPKFQEIQARVREGL
jgi:nicotinamide phosphoribosyltransferase